MNNDQFRTWPILRNIGSLQLGQRIVLTPDTLLTIVAHAFHTKSDESDDRVFVTVALAPITDGDEGLPQSLTTKWTTEVRVWPEGALNWHGAPTTIHG